jgi:hypothetical protein
MVENVSPSQYILGQISKFAETRNLDGLSKVAEACAWLPWTNHDISDVAYESKLSCQVANRYEYVASITTEGNLSRAVQALVPNLPIQFGDETLLLVNGALQQLVLTPADPLCLAIMSSRLSCLGEANRLSLVGELHWSELGEAMERHFAHPCAGSYRQVGHLAIARAIDFFCPLTKQEMTTLSEIRDSWFSEFASRLPEPLPSELRDPNLWISSLD